MVTAGCFICLRLQRRYRTRCNGPPGAVTEESVDGAISPSRANVDLTKVCKFFQGGGEVPLVKVPGRYNVRIPVVVLCFQYASFNVIKAGSSSRY